MSDDDGEGVDDLGLPGDTQTLYDVDAREMTLRKKVVPLLITTFITLWAVWVGRRAVPALLDLPSREPWIDETAAAAGGGGAAAWNASYSAATVQAVSEATLRRWEKDQLAKQLEEQEKRWKGVLQHHLKEHESRLQQDLSRRTKEVEGKVEDVKKSLKGLDEKLVVVEKSALAKATEEGKARTHMQEQLKKASEQLDRVTAETAALKKEIEKRAKEVPPPPPPVAKEAPVSPAVLQQVDSLQAQYDEITAKLELVQQHAKQVSTELEGLRHETERKIMAVVAEQTARAEAKAPAAAAAALALDESVIREEIVKPEIRKAQQQEEEQHAKLLERVEGVQRELTTVKGQLEAEKDKIKQHAADLLEKAAAAQAERQAAAPPPATCPPQAPPPPPSSSTTTPCPDMETYQKTLEEQVEKRLHLLAADEVGMVDHAAQRTGSTIISSHSSPTYTPGSYLLPTDWMHYLGVEQKISPRAEVISAKSKRPGDCWPMSGQSGNVTIMLHADIIPQAVTVQHIHHSINLIHGSAPKDFRVWGREASLDSPPIDLGKYTYIDGQDKVVQTFPLTTTTTTRHHHVATTAVRYITFEVLSNYGKKDFTCIYRLRVHGDEVNAIPGGGGAV